MALRVQTWFGIHIPPFKEEKYGAKSTTIRFALTGNIPSKKNNQQAVTIRKHARGWANEQAKFRQPTWGDVHRAISMCTSKMRGNAKYNEFLKKHKPIIHSQMKWWAERLSSKGLIFPISKSTVTVKLHFKSRYVQDTLNKQQTIQDLLVDAGVIVDDEYKCLNPIIGKSACYYEEIVNDIAFISLTTNLQQ